MKKILALLVICAMLMTTLASCDLLDKWFNKDQCTTHTDADGDYVCDSCGAELEKPKDPPACTEHKDEDGDEKCDDCGADVPKEEPPVCTEHKDEDGDEKCDECGADVPKEEPPVCTEHKDEDGDEKCDECGADVPKPECKEHKDLNNDYACDECGFVMFEDVKYSLNVSDIEVGTRASDDIYGRFTIVSSTEVRGRTKTYEGVEYTKSIKIGGKTNMIKVNVPGTGKLRFIIQNGSTGADMQFTKVIAPDGTVHDIEFVGKVESNPLVLIEIDVTEGEWTIARGKKDGTQDIFYLELACKVAVAPENGFELVSPGKTEYLVGDEFDTSDVRLNATFENGKTDTLELSKVTIDTSKVDMTKSGVYEVVISYKDYEVIKYNVEVYAPESMELHYDAVVKEGKNSAGNSIYYNYSFREVYGVGDSFKENGLSVIVVGKLGEKTLEFRVDNYDIAGFDSATAGAKTLTVSAYGVSKSTVVYVVDTAVAEGNKVKVDKAYTGEIGAIVDGYNMFTTIQQALDFLERAEKAERKLLVIGEGLFTEKLEIEIPYLTIRGAGAGKTIIEWDSLYGLPDASGFSHTTDSTQTVAVREGAIDCLIEGVTISNYWNSQERMDEANLGIERGLALLVMADHFIMRDSALLGIQDTLELFYGRQYFENVFISGYTDFIFGSNNTTYFKNCTIHVIDTVKDNQGTAGYLTAFKGSSSGESDSVLYGVIFDGCKFTADEGVMDGCTAIGRPWGAYAAVAIINSELGKHISVKGYDKDKNERYVSMTVKPTANTVKFVEYNNTGAGAISEPVAGMRMLTAEEAANYSNFAVIFGAKNGNVSYTNGAWDPTSDEIKVDDSKYYHFNGGSSLTGTSYTFDTTTTIQTGTTLTWEGLLISAENGKVAWNSNANALNMKAGAFIKFTVAAGTTVTVETYPNYNFFTLNGVGTASANMLSQHYAEETEVVLLSTGDLYIYKIMINPGEEALEAPTLSEIKVSGMTVNYEVGSEISLEGLVVNAIYSDNSVISITEYTVDTSAVNVNEAGEYEITVSYGGKTAVIKVTYEESNADPAITKNTVLDFTTKDGLAAVQSNPKVTITGNPRHNGAEIELSGGTISFQVKAGTVVTVIPYHNSSYVSYTVYAEGQKDDNVYNTNYSFAFYEDCTVIYEGFDNNYLCQISIECPLAEGKYVFGGSSIEGDVTGILESISGMSITGTCSTHSGGAQLGADSQIIFIAPALATVTIQGYDTQYGQLLVIVDGVPVEMNKDAQYVFTPLYASTVIIEAVNVGTEAEPAWNKSYITYIDIDLPTFVEENLTINFGTQGNYKDCGIDLSDVTIADNTDNSQVKNGSFSFAVRKGAIVTVHGYPGYVCYNLGDGDIVFESITDEYFEYEAWSDCVITISHTDAEKNNYFYSVDIEYPVVFTETTTIDLSKTGASIQGGKGEYEGLSVDATSGKFADNGSGWVQVNAGTIITLQVVDGAQVSVSAYSSADNFAISIANGVCTITCNANDYLNGITVSYQ